MTDPVQAPAEALAKSRLGWGTHSDRWAEREAVARALADHWRDMHTNESLGRQRMLAGHALAAMAPHNAAREQQAAAEATVERVEALAERDALVVKVARVEALVAAAGGDTHSRPVDYTGKPMPTYVSTADIRAALDGDRCSTCGGSLDSPPCSKNEDGTSGHTGGGGAAEGGGSVRQAHDRVLGMREADQ